MKLYYSPGASSLAPHIVAREAGLDVELVRVDLEARRVPSTNQPFAEINPMGKVPALALDDGSVLTEGSAVLQYLADRAAGGGLFPPADTAERYRVLEALSFVATELHKGFAPMFDPDLPPAYRRKMMSDATPLRRVAALVHEGPFVAGETFTVADAYLFVILRLGMHAGIDMSAWPEVGAFMDRVASRPHVRAAMRAEGLVDP